MRVSNSNYFTTLNKRQNTKMDSPIFNIKEINAETTKNSLQSLQKYDVCNATYDELCEISIKLYEKGKISLFDHAMLTFNPTLFPQRNWQKSYHLTKINQNGKRDWIAEFEARVKQDIKIGNTQGSIHNKRIVDILKNIAK